MSFIGDYYTGFSPSYPIPGGTGGPGYPSVQPIFQPPTGYQPWENVPVGGGICPVGTRCVGPSAEFLGLSFCLGTCSPYDVSTGPVGGGECSEAMRAVCATGVSDPASIAICQRCGFTVGSAFDPTTTTPTPYTPTTTNGKCGCASSSCELPNKRRGRLNKTRYYRFGDCRRGTRPGVVEAGTVCTTPRKTNFGNDKAAMRAASRLEGAARHYKKMLDAVASVQSVRNYRKPRRKR